MASQAIIRSQTLSSTTPRSSAQKLTTRSVKSIPVPRQNLAALLYAWPRKNTSFASPVTDTNELSYVMDTLLACVAAQRSQP